MAPRPLSRRTFILAGAGAIALAACGGDDGEDSSGPTTDSARPFELGRFFPEDALTIAGPQRLTFTLLNQEGSQADDVPPSLTFTVEKDGAAIGQPIAVPAHNEGLERSYFPLIFTPTGPGVYTVRTEVEGIPIDSAVQIPATSAVKQPGQALTPVETPTSDNLRGADFLCTRTPEPCPLHDVTLAAALTSGQPVAFLISTPEFCQFAVCGPVLEILLGVVPQFPQVKFLHSEVYSRIENGQIETATLVDAVKAQGLTYEPVLFLTNPDGTISQRLDTIFDAAEVRDALTKLVA